MIFKIINITWCNTAYFFATAVNHLKNDIVKDYWAKILFSMLWMHLSFFIVISTQSIR